MSCDQVDGYPDRPSVRPREQLVLRVSTRAAAFHVDVHRLGATPRRISTRGPYPGRWRPPGRPGESWGWPLYSVDVPAGWEPGVYVAALHPCVDDHHRQCLPQAPVAVDGRSGRVLFVVRPALDATPAPILYKVPLFTYHAYNATGGASMYIGDATEATTGRRRLTLARPGGGTGGALSFPTAVDVYDPGTPREGVAHWDLPFIGWLEENGYGVDYCTDLDLHDDATVLEGHHLLLSVGHDEYWSAAMRDAVEAFVRAGGNAAFFSGNTCFWRVEVEAGAMTCHHPPLATDDADQWWLSRPEAALTGVSYRHGGGWWSGPRNPLGYTVAQAGHWVWSGTGVRDGQVIGAEQRLVGYECDGAVLDSRPGPPRAAGTHGTPADFTVLGVAQLTSQWQDIPGGPAAAATMGVHTPGGQVFTAATTDWSRVLRAGDPAVERVTRTVLDRLSLASVRVRGPAMVTAGGQADVWLDEDVFLGDRQTGMVHWECSGGAVVASGTAARVTAPGDSGPLTVSVTVHDDMGRPAGFGALTLEVLSRRAAAQVALLEAVRTLLATTAPAPAPGSRPARGNRELADPRWEPLRDGLRRLLADDEVTALAAAARVVIAAADRMTAGP